MRISTTILHRRTLCGAISRSERVIWIYTVPCHYTRQPGRFILFSISSLYSYRFILVFLVRFCWPSGCSAVIERIIFFFKYLRGKFIWNHLRIFTVDCRLFLLWMLKINFPTIFVGNGTSLSFLYNLQHENNGVPPMQSNCYEGNYGENPVANLVLDLVSSFDI